jgi:hypothetical protein
MIRPEDNLIRYALSRAFSEVGSDSCLVFRKVLTACITSNKDIKKRQALTKRGNILGEKARVCSGKSKVRTKKTADRAIKKAPMIISLLPMFFAQIK